MKEIVVLGTGRVGSAIINDLVKDYRITVVDTSSERLANIKQQNPTIQTIQADVTKQKVLHKVISNCDLVIGALPGHLGFSILKEVILSGKDIVDISFFPEDPFLLSNIAQEKNITAIVDCGVAPGLSNILLGHLTSLYDEIESFICYVGGLPCERFLPFEYKAPFSPIDVIEEYTRPAKFVEEGKIVIKPAMTDLETIDIKGIGTLEAFNTDGLRTLLKTMNIKSMKEKTLRYPGHVEKIRVLLDTGFFSKEEIMINGSKIRPLDFTAKILFPKWKLEEDEEDVTILRVIIKTKEKEYQYDLLDFFDRSTKTTSMARTTGYTCTAIARLLIENKITEKGIIAPEIIGKNDEYYNYLLKEYKKRNINIIETIR